MDRVTEMSLEPEPIHARHDQVDALLADGAVVRIRDFRPEDRDAVLALHDQASEESLYLRFFTTGRLSAHRYVDHLCSPGTTAVALVAEQGERILGMATAEPSGPGVAEVSFFVGDDTAGKGVATLLLEHLAARARNEDRHRFVAEVKAINHRMLAVLHDAGFELTERLERDVVHIEMSTSAVARAVAAADARECASEARSLVALTSPASVAVAGVRQDGTGIGRAILDAIREGGFAGRLTVLHPRLHEVEDVPAVPSASAARHPIELLIVAVPVAQVLEVVADAARSGVRCAVIVTSGFAEAGPEGLRLQHELVAVARRFGMRLIGPNCFGVARPGIGLNATFARTASVPGRLAIASQSGGVGIALQDAVRREGLGLAAFVSLGNKADVSGNDLLCAWSVDDEIDVAALYLESFGNARASSRAWRAGSASASRCWPSSVVVRRRVAARGPRTRRRRAARRPRFVPSSGKRA